MPDAVLSIEGLSAGYDQAAVIRGVDLHVGAGEIVALLGPNGAGKTTTLRAVSGLVKPLAGRVVLDGQDLVRRDERVIAAYLGSAATELELGILDSTAEGNGG